MRRRGPARGQALFEIADRAVAMEATPGRTYCGGANALIGVKLFDGVILKPVATKKTLLFCARIISVPWIPTVSADRTCSDCS